MPLLQIRKQKWLTQIASELRPEMRKFTSYATVIITVPSTSFIHRMNKHHYIYIYTYIYLHIHIYIYIYICKYIYLYI